MCQWNLGFDMNRIAPQLLAFRLTDWPSNLYSRVAKNWQIYKASFPAFVIAIYSTSVKKKAIVACCFN